MNIDVLMGCLKKYSLLFFIFFTTIVLAQPDLSFSTLSTKEGLSNSRVRAINKDKVGFMWTGTDNGLNRFDGKVMKVYYKSDTLLNQLPNNSINHLYNALNGDFLISTNKGVCRYNRVKDAFDTYLLDSVKVKKIVQSKFTKKFYVATDIGLFVFSDSYELLFHYDKNNSNIPSLFLEDVVEDLNGSIWLSIKSLGVYELVKKNDFVRYSLKGVDEKVLYSSSLLLRKSGELLLCVDGQGVFKLNSDDGLFEPLVCNNCTPEMLNMIVMHEDSQNRLWIGGGDYGLALYDEVKYQFYHYRHDKCTSTSINAEVVSAIFDDQKGSLWVGTLFQGLNYVDLENSTFHMREEIEGARGRTIVCDVIVTGEGEKWISTDGGISHFNKNDSLIYAYNNKESYATLNMAIDREGNVWGATYLYGLHYINAKTHKKEIYRHKEGDPTSIASDIVWYVMIDDKGDVWVATSLGVCKFNPNTKTFTTINSSNSLIKNSNTRIVYQDKLGQYWFGTEEGLYQYDNESGDLKEYRHHKDNPKSITNDWVVTMTEDLEGFLWLGTFGGGISRYNSRTDDFTNWDNSDGLCDNYISAIEVDSENKLWISTPKGLVQFDVESNYFKDYHVRNQFGGENFYINSSTKLPDGRILFGCTNGLVSFNPKNVNSNPFAPDLVLIDFKVLNKSVDFNKKRALFDKHISYVQKLSLPYDYTSFTIQFAALNYVLSNKNQYAYMLEGFDERWINIGNHNEVTYTDLPPGDYVFKLKASNNDDVWTVKPLTLNIEIEQPFYSSLLFRLLTLLALIIAVLLVFKFRMKRMVFQKKNLEKEVDRRTKVIEEKTQELKIKNNRHIQSLDYARLIQQASLPELEEVNSGVEIEVLYIPSQIVSGDFYWMKEVAGKTFIAAVDCTGHGVPGAFMSLIGNVALGNIITYREIYSPEEVLEALHREVVKSLHQQKTKNQDGMDMSLVVIDKKAKTIEYAGALSPFVFIQDDKLNMIRGDRHGIGGATYSQDVSFKKHVIDVSVPTTFYLFSDGYQDQFGGESNRKFLATKFRALLFEGYKLPMSDQIGVLRQKHLEWKKEEEQTDDILVIGVKIDL